MARVGTARVMLASTVTNAPAPRRKWPRVTPIESPMIGAEEDRDSARDLDVHPGQVQDSVALIVAHPVVRRW